MITKNRFTKHNRKLYSLEKVKESQSTTKLDQQKEQFNKDLDRIQETICKEVYFTYKFTHNGLVSYKVFENCHRRVHNNSLMNLLNIDKSSIFYDEYNRPFDENFGIPEKDIREYRVLSSQQIRDCRKLSNKLAYYTRKREFTSKKSGKYQMKIGFITLTTPDNTTNEQSLKAFEGFLDYLRRTANCVYVWKKEIGEKGKRLHYHIMVNNFIPYYIVSWKWKRLLISQGVIWQKNELGEDYNAHYRIELPRNKKQTASYITKYIAKGCELHKSIGYIFGCSDILKKLEETKLIEGEVSKDELWQLIKNNKTVGTDYVSIVCCDLMKVRKIAPEIYSIFEKQFYEFQAKISLPQRFMSV